MNQGHVDQGCAEYTFHSRGEIIYGTKEQLQAFGIGIGLAFPGEPNGPVRQLTLHDPRGLRVRIKMSYWKAPFEASIDYAHVPERAATPECSPFSGVRMREGPWTDDFTGRPESLIAAGLVTAEQLPGAPGMRKTRVTILADGSILSGNYSNSIPGGLATGVTHIERASPRSATFTVRVHVDRGERDRRESRRQIAESAWQHEVGKLPRPRRLVSCHAGAVDRHVDALAAARNDTSFQALVGRLVQLPAGGAS